MNRSAATRCDWRFGLTRQSYFMLLSLIVCGTLPGCLSARGLIATRHRDPLAGAPRLQNVRNPRVEEVVAHLNQNTNRIQSWRANSVKIRADKWSLAGTIAVEKGRHLRLVVTSLRGNEVDLGCNHERFWVWSREMDPSFVTCKHENLERARHQLGIPFEPDWLLQALGVSPLPSTGISMELDAANEQARLVEQVVSVEAAPMRRVVLVDLKRGIVLEHSLYTVSGSSNSARTRIAMAKLGDHRLDQESGVVLAHRVLIELPQNNMSMTMNLGEVQINPKSIPSVVWDMPQIRDCQVVHLDAGVPPGGIRTAIRPATSPSAMDHAPIETVRSHDPHNFYRDQDFQEQAADSSAEDLPDDMTAKLPGRSQLSDSAPDEFDFASEAEQDNEPNSETDSNH